MPTYEVRRRTVLTFSVVTAANETEARLLARDAWQQDAAIAALAADVTRRPNHEPRRRSARLPLRLALRAERSGRGRRSSPRPALRGTPARLGR